MLVDVAMHVVVDIVVVGDVVVVGAAGAWQRCRVIQLPLLGELA